MNVTKGLPMVGLLALAMGLSAAVSASECLEVKLEAKDSYDNKIEAKAEKESCMAYDLQNQVVDEGKVECKSGDEVVDVEEDVQCVDEDDGEVTFYSDADCTAGNELASVDLGASPVTATCYYDDETLTIEAGTNGGEVEFKAELKP